MERRNVSSAASSVDKSSESFYVKTQGVSPHVRESPHDVPTAAELDLVGEQWNLP